MDVDMTVIGAGPVGLYAAYYAGFPGMRTAIPGSRPEPDDQISTLYDAPPAAAPAPAGAG